MNLIKTFTTNKLAACLLAIGLCVTTTNYACNTAQWLSTIGRYLPVAIQVAQSIVGLIGVFNTAASTEDQAIVKQIGDEATKDFQLLQSLYQQYESKPSADTKAQIETVLATIVNNLPDLLATAHIKDPGLLQKVTASVNIVVTIADVIIAQIPVSNPQLKARKAAKRAVRPMTPAGVKAAWDSEVCGGNSACTVLVKGS